MRSIRRQKTTDTGEVTVEKERATHTQIGVDVFSRKKKRKKGPHTTDRTSRKRHASAASDAISSVFLSGAAMTQPPGPFSFPPQVSLSISSRRQRQSRAPNMSFLHEADSKETNTHTHNKKKARKGKERRPKKVMAYRKDIPFGH